jgi:hypothetical protein
MLWLLRNESHWSLPQQHTAPPMECTLKGRCVCCERLRVSDSSESSSSSESRSADADIVLRLGPRRRRCVSRAKRGWHTFLCCLFRSVCIGCMSGTLASLRYLSIGGRTRCLYRGCSQDLGTGLWVPQIQQPRARPFAGGSLAPCGPR